MAAKIVFILLCVVYLKEVSSHGMMLDPLNRASLWRNNTEAPINYDDNGFNCGGFLVQHSQNGGLCGACGDNYADAVPRSNENTGTYGNGIITRIYSSGTVITTSIKLTANHLGTFTYSLCNIEDSSKPETEDCFTNLALADGSSVYNVLAGQFELLNQVQLPAGVTCAHCSLRWHYTAGNSWGSCDDGSSRLGCGPQETFRSCADITIV